MNVVITLTIVMLMTVPFMLLVNETEGSVISADRSNTNTNTTASSTDKFVTPYSTSQGFQHNRRLPVSTIRSGPPNAGDTNHPSNYYHNLIQGFAGLDLEDYPGNYAMRWLLHNTNLRWTGFYLSPAPAENNTIWMINYQQLKDLGWGFAPIFAGQQEPGIPGSHILTVKQGIFDAHLAVKLAHQAGFPEGSIIFLDIQTTAVGHLSSAFMDYYRAWIKEIFDNNFKPGVYCYFKIADQIHSIDWRVIFWVFNLNKYTCSNDERIPYPQPNPSNSNVAFASVWQLIEDCNISWNSGSIIRVDLDSAATVDPSQIKVRTFMARLGGGDEITHVITRSTGEAKFQLSSDNNSLSYEIDLRNINGVLSANLYEENGSIMAQLFNPYTIHTPTGLINGVFLQGNLTSDDLQGPLTGSNLHGLVNLIKKSHVYVNIRTQQHQKGEIRGQILQASM